jgi:hypothetical protein
MGSAVLVDCVSARTPVGFGICIPFEIVRIFECHHQKPTIKSLFVDIGVIKSPKVRCFEWFADVQRFGRPLLTLRTPGHCGSLVREM